VIRAWYYQADGAGPQIFSTNDPSITTIPQTTPFTAKLTLELPKYGVYTRNNDLSEVIAGPTGTGVHAAVRDGRGPGLSNVTSPVTVTISVTTTGLTLDSEVVQLTQQAVASGVWRVCLPPPSAPGARRRPTTVSCS